MIRRLIVFIIVFAIFLAFITLNLENKCNIGFGFHTFENVPVFLTVFISFITGFLFALPLIFWKGKNKLNDTEKSKTPVIKEESPPSFKGGKFFTKRNTTKDSSNDSL